MHRLCLRSLNATSSSHLTTISCCTYKELILGKKTVNLIAYNCLITFGQAAPIILSHELWTFISFLTLFDLKRMRPKHDY